MPRPSFHVLVLLSLWLVPACRTVPNPDYCEGPTDCDNGWMCNTDRNECVPPPGADCETSADCTLDTEPICDDTAGEPSCRRCNNDDECLAKNGNAPYCNTGTGECIAMEPPECTNSDVCAGTKPICDTGAGMCQACTDADGNASCAMLDGEVPLCVMEGEKAGSCVQCLEKTHCNSDNPVCDQAMNICAGCTEHAHCADYSGACGGTGACAAEADVIYVSDTTGLDTNDCSAGAPCKTIGHALTLVTATRQFIRILDGANYTGNLTIGLTVTIIGNPTTRITGGTDNQPAIRVQPSSSLTLDTLTVQSSGIGASAHGIQCLASDSTVTLSGVTVRDNPGVGFDISGCLLTVKRSLITGNGSGGIRLTGAGFDITNSFIVDNGSAASEIGGVLITNGTSKTPQRFAFNTVVDNLVGAAAAASGVACTVADADIEADTVVTTSSIIRRGAASKPATSGNCVWIHSNVEGIDTTPPTTNIDDSCMIEYDGEDLPRVGASSPCLDGGEPSTGIVDDYDGEKRSDTTPDMGADELE